jgi:hypothetical protein
MGKNCKPEREGMASANPFEILGGTATGISEELCTYKTHDPVGKTLACTPILWATVPEGLREVVGRCAGPLVLYYIAPIEDPMIKLSIAAAYGGGFYLYDKVHFLGGGEEDAAAI